jgi:hypothetical protein
LPFASVRDRGLKFGHDLALTQKMPLAVANVTFGGGKFGGKRRPVHAR